MNYAFMMLIVFIIWVFLYFVIDEKIEKVITKIDIATLLLLGVLFVTLWLGMRERQVSIFTAILPGLIYLTIAVNMLIKGIVFMRSRKEHLKVNDLSQ